MHISSGDAIPVCFSAALLLYYSIIGDQQCSNSRVTSPLSAACKHTNPIRPHQESISSLFGRVLQAGKTRRGVRHAHAVSGAAQPKPTLSVCPRSGRRCVSLGRSACWCGSRFWRISFFLFPGGEIASSVAAAAVPPLFPRTREPTTQRLHARQ